MNGNLQACNHTTQKCQAYDKDEVVCDPVTGICRPIEEEDEI